MMPLAIEPAMPCAETKVFSSTRSAAATPAAAPMAPSTAVGWNPAEWMRRGATRLARHITSAPTAMPNSRSGPSMRWRSAAASSAGTITAPA